MKEEYIIINKTAIQKRIEELKHQRELAGNLFEDREYNLNSISMELRILEQILSQSNPLIPEIEKAVEAGFYKGYNVGQNDAQSHPLALTIANNIHNDRQNYISQLKLDI